MAKKEPLEKVSSKGLLHADMNMIGAADFTALPHNGYIPVPEVCPA